MSCNYAVRSWAYLPDHYHCEVTRLDVHKPKQFIVKVNGPHLDGFSNADVKSVYINAKVCHYIPMGLTNFFPNLEAIQIHNSGLKTVDRLDLIEFNKLHSIYFSNNMLTSLDAGLFFYTPNLRRIEFQVNRLRHIDATIFDDLEKLEHAHFGFNICTGEIGEHVGRNKIRYQLETLILEKCQHKEFATKIDDKVTKELLMYRLLNVKFDNEL